ncbi:putative RNA-directed DNA polymerase, eukaryota, reverse transcriptase zinc-binding domain protein [Tanacetum coccineum]
MIRPVTDLEIKEAMFSIRNDKSPGLDGFTAAFFKEAWDIVASDVINAVKEFFVNGMLPKELNHTIIAVIPKVSSPTRINDYRPISCCNVLFKCISKIILNRIKRSLKVLVSSNQSAFVPGRRISNNILLTQELMHNYHLDRGTPRWALVDDKCAMPGPHKHEKVYRRGDTGVAVKYDNDTRILVVVWECIRPRNTMVPWFNVVWFSKAIPRHAFLMWLVIKGKLKTQDKMVGWNTSLICPLCESQPDSHTHLFFECSFSDQVWSRMKVLAGLSTASSSISNVVDQIVPIFKRR